MANEPEHAKNGVFIDTATGKVVRSRPVEGVQLVPPGGELTADRKAAIEAAEAASGPVEEAIDTTAVETATAKIPSARKARS